MKQYDSFEDEIEARCRPCEEHEFPRIATYRCCYTDDESPGKRLQVSKFQSTSTNSDIQNSDMIGAKKNEQKNKTTQVSPAGFDMTRRNRAALLW